MDSFDPESQADITAAGVVPCDGPKKSPSISPIVQITSLRSVL